MLVKDIVKILQDVPGDYITILADNSPYPGTNWTYDIEVQVDHEMRVVRIMGECT